MHNSVRKPLRSHNCEEALALAQLCEKAPAHAQLREEAPELAQLCEVALELTHPCEAAPALTQSCEAALELTQLSEPLSSHHSARQPLRSRNHARHPLSSRNTGVLPGRTSLLGTKIKSRRSPASLLDHHPKIEHLKLYSNDFSSRAKANKLLLCSFQPRTQSSSPSSHSSLQAPALFSLLSEP